MYYPKFRPYAEPNPAYDSWLFAQRAYSEPLLHLFALLKFRIPAAHSAFILSHLPLGLTLLPICMSLTYPVGLADSELTLSPPAVLTVCVPSFPLLQLVGLFRCRFDFCNVQACALAAYSPQ